MSKKNQKKSTTFPGEFTESSDVPRNIPISLIDVTYNYRRFFAQDELHELANNIKEHGLMQPIIVRPLDNGRFGLVFGERRLRAHSIANLETISAKIMVLTDSQVLQMQLSENLQREDVSPLEEASAFQASINQGIDIAEISTRVGKSPNYIAGRLSLINLIDPFQELLLHDHLTLRQAIYLSRFEQVVQSSYFDQTVNGTKIGSFKELKDFFEKKFQMPLSKAVFPLEKRDLIPHASDCASCANNSSYNLVLFNDMTEPTCLDRLCFLNKTSEWYFLNILSFSKDICLVRDYNWTEIDTDLSLIGRLECLNIQILSIEQTSYPLAIPVMDEKYPVIKDFDSEDDLNDAIAEYEQVKINYQLELDAFNKSLENGEILRGFMVSGNKRFSHFYFTPRKSFQSQATTPMTVLDILNLDIAKLKQKKARGLELDEEKIHIQRIENLKAIDSFSDSNFEHQQDLNEVEKNALLIVMYQSLNYLIKDSFCNHYNIKGSTQDIYSKVVNLPVTAKTFLARQFIKNNLFKSYIKDLAHTASMEIGKAYSDQIGINEIISIQNTAKVKREGRLKERINLIKLQINDLSKEQIVTTDDLVPSISEMIAS